MDAVESRKDKAIVEWGPCCFCGEVIAKRDVNPCRLTVETEQGKWQTWFCHAACFRERLIQLPESPGFLDPAHF